MAARKTTKTATPKVTVSVVVSKAIIIPDAEDDCAAVRILQRDGKLKITRITDCYGYNPGSYEEWEACDDNVTLTVADLKAAVEALDA